MTKLIVAFRNFANAPKKLCSKKCVHNCCPVRSLRVKAFLSRIITGHEAWTQSLWTTGQKDNQWKGIIQLLSGRRWRLPLVQGKSWANPLWMQKVWLWYTLCRVVKPLTQIFYINTVEAFPKPLRRVRPERNFAEILLQHDNARPNPLKTGEVITKL